MKVFLLSELVPKEVKESIREISCCEDINEMKEYDSYSVLSVKSIPDAIPNEIITEYNKYLIIDNANQKIYS